MKRIPITIYDECDAFEHIPAEGECTCPACREAHAQVVQWQEQRPKDVPLCMFGPTRTPWMPRAGFNLSDCMCIAVIVAFAGWVFIEVVRNW